ncbi:MAG: hypothetical protein HOC71_04570 [Candidatus Latescibacteria bacterium]|jgi:hypothetical protein|nr:hypothetical protein [Candidatus Latescibacterota bacterium]
MISKERQIDDFNNFGNMYFVWQYFAENLLLSSKYLYDEHFKVDHNIIKEGETPSGGRFEVIGSN